MNGAENNPTTSSSENSASADRTLPFLVQRLAAADAKAYNEFLIRGVRAHPDTLRIDEADILSSPFATARSEDSVTLVGLADRTWVGTVCIEREGGRAKRAHIAWILRMLVDSAYANRGLGRLLLAAAVERARAMPGIAKVNLTVAAHNAAAVHLYRSAGFIEFSRESDAFRAGQSHVELSLSLSLDEQRHLFERER